MRGEGHTFRIDRPAAAMLIGLPILAGIVLGANQTRAGAYLPWVLSIVYWLVTSLATWWLFGLATLGTRALLKPWSPPDWTIWLTGAVVGSFLARPAIYTIVAMFRPVMHAPNLRQMVPARPDLDFLAYYLTNWSVVIAMWMISCWWLRKAARRTAASPPAPPGETLPSPPALHGMLLRLPRQIGHEVVALQAEDHYVRVHTRLGNALLLGSLSDAIADVQRSGMRGQRTHRSWWVAEDAVTTTSRRGRHLILVLCNQIEVPISVSYRQSAIAGGILAA